MPPGDFLERSRRSGWLLAAILAGAAAARSLGYEQVFVGGGDVAFAPGDPFYHVHRALWSFEHFPAVLRFDPCINYPDGGLVPHPPLLDWSVAALGRALGMSRAGFLVLEAWLPVVFGALGVLPVLWIGTRVRSRALGLGAAALYAFLPIATMYSAVGNADHHAAVSLLGALALAGAVALLGGDLPPRREARMLALLALGRAALLLVWNGALLYVVPLDAAIALAGALRRAPRLLAGEALSLLASACLLLPFVAAAPTPSGGPYSATELSRFPLLALLAGALACGGAAALERRQPARSAAAAALRFLGVAATALAVLLAIPGVSAGLARALAFLGRSDGYTEHVAEQLPPFFDGGRVSLRAGERWLGGFVYLVPIVPALFLAEWRQRDVAAGLLLCGWTALFGFLAFTQLRYGNDYAAAGCVGFALAAARLGDALRAVGRARLARAAPLAAGGLGLALAVPSFYVPRSKLTLRELAGALPVDRALLSVSGSQLRFAEAVAAVTPDSADCLRASGPSSGILAHPSLGHALHQVAHRATPADPLGPYAGRANFDRAVAFLAVESESEAVALTQALRTPFVATAEEGEPNSRAAVAFRLQREDGSARRDAPALGRFRLVTEGPAGGVGISVVFDSILREGVPYKLFEVVPGAEIDVETVAGDAVTARVPVLAPSGRRFFFRATAIADGDGVARLRVPYPTEAPPDEEPARAPVARAQGPYEIASPLRRWRARVEEGDVASGRRVRAEAAGS